MSGTCGHIGNPLPVARRRWVQTIITCRGMLGNGTVSLQQVNCGGGIASVRRYTVHINFVFLCYCITNKDRTRVKAFKKFVSTLLPCSQTSRFLSRQTFLAFHPKVSINELLVH